MQVTVTGLKEKIDQVSKMAQSINDLTPAWDNIAGVTIQEFRANIDGKGAVLAMTWPERKRSYSWPILNKTGRLKGSWVADKSPKQLTITNATEYATYHQFGTPKMPARPIIGMTREILDNILNRIKAYILTQKVS